MKKLVVLLSMLICLFATDGIVKVNMSDTVWNLSVPNDNQVHVVYLPTDIDWSTLQASIKYDQTLIVYNLAAYSSWMEQFTGKPFVAAVKITKDSVTYLSKYDGGNTVSKQDYSSFLNYINTLGLSQNSGFVLSNYLTYFGQIKAAGVYYIKSIGSPLTFNINFGSSSDSNASAQAAGSGEFGESDGIVKVNMSDTVWNLSVPNDNQVHVVYLPTDIDWSTLQASIKYDQTLIVYNLAAYSSWMEQFTGKPFVAAVKITKDSVTYLSKYDGGNTVSKQDYSSFLNYINTLGLSQNSGFVLSNYLTYFGQIKAAGVYYIKSIGSPLTFNINFGSSSSSEASYYHITSNTISGVKIELEDNTEVNNLTFCPNGNYRDIGSDANDSWDDAGTWSVSDGKLIMHDSDGTYTVIFDTIPAVNSTGRIEKSTGETSTFSINSILTGMTNDDCNISTPSDIEMPPTPPEFDSNSSEGIEKPPKVPSM